MSSVQKIYNIRATDLLDLSGIADDEVITKVAGELVGTPLSSLGGSGSSPPITITSNTTLGATDTCVLCNAGSGSFTATLMSAGSASGSLVMLKKVDASANTVTVVGQSSSTIDGAANYLLEFEDEFVQLRSDGTNWFVVGE